MTRWRCIALAAALFGASTPAARALEIISREEWGAKPAVLPMTAQKPDRITIHHTAVKTNAKLSIEKKLRGLQSFSQSKAKLADGRTKKQWADIPYHYYISVDGKVAEARPARFVGDTNTNYDPSGHITIVVEGNFETETPTPAELTALRELVATLAGQYNIPAGRIGVHKDFAQTECPGRNLEGRVREIAADLGGKPAAR